MKKYLFLLAALCLSCNNKSEIFDRFDRDFDENRWNPTDAKTYEFRVADDTKPYDIVCCFSHVYGYQFSSVPLLFTITDPGGKVTQKPIDLQLKDAAGKELGDCSGDYCDLDYTLQRGQKLQKGTYKISVSHTFEGPYLPNVLGVGLRVTMHQTK